MKMNEVRIILIGFETTRVYTVNNGHMGSASSPNVKTFIPIHSVLYISRALHAVPSIINQ